MGLISPVGKQRVKVGIRALAIERESVSCSNDGTLSLHQFLIESASARQNSGFPSSFFAAWPKMWFQN